MHNVDNWNRLYRTQGHDLPWCVETMPSWFTEVVNSGWTHPCKALDVGCGVGNYAFHLAEQGYEVLCVDHSETAIALAKAKNSHPSLRFMIESTEHLDSLGETFDFIYDISLLHHLKPHRRDAYAAQLASLLNAGGKFMLCVFSDDEERFGRTNEFLNPVTGTITSLLSKEEILNTFTPLFTIDRLDKIPFDNYLRYLCLMRKK